MLNLLARTCRVLVVDATPLYMFDFTAAKESLRYSAILLIPSILLKLFRISAHDAKSKRNRRTSVVQIVVAK